MLKIRYKLLAVILVFTLTPQLILDYLSAKNIENHIISRYDLIAEHKIEAIEHAVDSTISDSELQLDSMVRNIGYVYNETLQVDEDALDQFLRITEESSDNIPNFFIGTAQGEMHVYPKSELPKGYDPRTRSWHQNATLNKSHINWIGPYIDQGTKQLVMTVSQYYLYKGREGVVGIDVELSSIRDMLRAEDLGAFGEVFLVNSQGEIIIHENESFEGLNMKFTKYFSEGVQKALDIGHYTSQNYRFNTMPIQDDMYAVTLVDLREVNGQIQKELSRNRTVPIIFGLLSIFVAFYLSHRMTKPIYRLIEAMRRTELGESFEAVKVMNNDELGLLTNEFNQMSEGLKEAHEEMTALNEELKASEETLQDQYDELIRNRDQIAESELRYKTIFELSNEGLWEQTVNGLINPLSVHWFAPYFSDREEMTHENWVSHIHEEDREKYETTLENHLQGVTPYCHEIYRVKDLEGQVHVIETKAKLSSRASYSYKGKTLEPILIGSHLDVTERRQNEEEIIQMAYFDPVTKLANRRNYERELDRMLKDHRWGYLIYMDIANFKQMNEEMGYAHGDKILQDLAGRIERTFGNAFAARVAGDEFALILGEDYTDHLLKEKMVLFNSENCCTDFESIQYKIHLVSCKFPAEGKTVEELYMTLLGKLKTAKKC